VTRVGVLGRLVVEKFSEGCFSGCPQEPCVSERNGVVNPSRVCAVRICLILVSAIPVLPLAGCSSSKTAPTNQSAVTFTAPKSGATIDQGQTVNVTVTVAPDPGGKGVTWTLQNATYNQKPAGTLTGQTATSATYNAPASVTGQTQVNVIATSVADPTQSASLSVMVEPPPAITTAVPTPLTSCPSSGSVVLPGVGAVASVGTAYISTFTESGGTAPFTWSATGLPNGLTLAGNGPTEATISGMPASSLCQAVSLQVTDAAGTSSPAMNFVMLVVPTPLSPRLPNITGAYVDPNPPNNGIPYRPTLLSASGGVPPYSWSVGSGSVPPPGLSVSSAGVLGGTPSAQGLSQDGGLGSYGFTAVVNDTQAPYPAAGVANLSIGVNYLDSSCHSGLESSLTATAPYAFLLRGFDKNGPVVLAGNFTADGTGNITGGNEDINRSGGAQTGLSLQAAGSSYTIGSDNRGCLTLANSAGTTTTFRFSLGTCSTTPNQQQGGCLPDASSKPGYFTRGRLIEFDDASGAGTRGSGILRLQDPTAFTSSALSGMYAFGLSGWDSGGQRYAMAGSASASSGSLSSVAADLNDAGALSSTLTGGSGTYNIAASGRGTATLSVGSANFNLTAYPVSRGEVILASTDTLAASHPLVSGESLSTTAPFDGASLPNSYMLHMTGVSGSAPDPNIGVLTFDGLSSISGTVYENQGGTLGSTAISATYAIDATSGRLALTTPQIGQTVGPHPFVAYIIPTTSGTAGFVVSTDASVQAGALEFQALNPPAATFRTANVVAGYFFSADEEADAASLNSTGTISASGTGSQAGNEDLSSDVAPHLVPNQGFTGSYSVNKNGTGNFGGETVSVTNGKIVYSLDESPLDLHPTITVVEQ
jgi:hypothetical protein